MTAISKQNELGHQAQKAQATRNKIIDAVISLINESGYSATSSTAIAKKANITWGAVQHHFGNKEEILLAVLEKSHDVYMALMSSDDLRVGSLEDRVDLFVDKVWEHYKSDLYFAFLEIIMAGRGNKGKFSVDNVWLQKLMGVHEKMLEDIFDAHKLPKPRLNEALLFVHRFLTGLSVDKILEPGLSFERTHIKRIKEGLLAIIDPG